MTFIFHKTNVGFCDILEVLEIFKDLYRGILFQYLVILKICPSKLLKLITILYNTC